MPKRDGQKLGKVQNQANREDEWTVDWGFF